MEIVFEIARRLEEVENLKGKPLIDIDNVEIHRKIYEACLQYQM